MTELGDPLPDLGIDVYNSATPPALAAGGAVSVAIYQDGTILASGGAVPVGGTVLAVSNPSTGIYTTAYTPLITGTFTVLWTVTGANSGTQTTVYTVELPAVGIVNLAEVKQRLRISRTDNDDYLQSLILAASDICESAEGTDRVWRRTVVTDEAHSSSGESFALNKTPVISVASVVVNGVTEPATSYDLANGRLYSVNGYWAGSTRRNNVVVSYVAGITGPVPAGVRTGVVEMVRHLYAASRGGSGVARQEEPDYTQGAGYLIPNRVTVAWRAYSGASLG